jgi:hypothetical protein
MPLKSAALETGRAEFSVEQTGSHRAVGERVQRTGRFFGLT